tara:strand:- start:568 stop:861 length:294 start_codon:yes stop_codon:yes gene_type:complete
MQAYSKEYRRDVLAACDGGEGTQAVALRFGCSESWVRRIKQVRREEHRVTAKLTRQRTPKWAPLEGAIRQAIAETPDLTLSERNSGRSWMNQRCAGR